MKLLLFLLIASGCGVDPKQQSAAAGAATAQDPAKGDPGASGKDGAAGPKGEKGDPGAAGKKGEAGAQGPKGDLGGQGGGGVDGSNGTNGAQGVPGAAGSTGARGAAGALNFYNAAGVRVGLAVEPDAVMVMLDDGGFFYSAYYDGVYGGSLGYDGTHGNVGVTCGFVSTDCSGQCYLIPNTEGYDVVPTINAVVYDGQKLWRFAGEEVHGYLSYHSHWHMASQPINVCKAGNVATNTAYPMVHQEILPAGVTFPFGPLHFGPAQ